MTEGGEQATVVAETVTKDRPRPRPAAREQQIGARKSRREDARFLQGHGHYVDDVRRPGMLQLAFARSEYAHARITSIDVEDARDVEGVVAVLTHEDLRGVVEPVLVETSLPSYRPTTMPPLASDRVRYVGEPIVAVVAHSRYEAEDGVEAVVVEAAELPPVMQIESAISPGAELVHETAPGNLFNEFEVKVGEAERVMASADWIFEAEYRNGRVCAVPLEPRATVAEWDASGARLTVWSTQQTPHLMRTGLSRFLGISEADVRVISPDVGGGFGSKMTLYAEDLVVCAAARLTGRPVKWTSDRREDLLTSTQGREQIHRIRAAVDERGRIGALQAEVLSSNGAHAIWPFTAGLDSGQASENIPGPYDIAHYDRDVKAVVTNKAPMGPYRGVGRVMACFTMERTVDEIARHLDIEPLELRKRNVVRSYPHATPAGLVFESGSSAESLDLMEELLALPRFREEQRSLRADGVYLGVGLAGVVEHNSLGPKQVAAKGIDIGLGLESATIRVEPDGTVIVIVGTHSHGQGHETTFAQVVAEQLEIVSEQVSVRYGDTDMVPYGMGTWASRSLVYAGGAAIRACRDIREKGLQIVAAVQQRSADELAWRDGVIVALEGDEVEVPFRELALIATHKPHLISEAVDPGLQSTRYYKAPDPGTFSNSLHAAIVDVDIETGLTKILRWLVVEDCGTIVNPLVVDGQVQGGVAQGIGQALLEEAFYDDDGQPLATTFMDYLLPGFNEVPPMEVHHLETPSPINEGGFKGMGEGGAINAPAAIANAVTDALRPFDVRIDSLPIRPAAVVRAVAEAKGRSA